MYAIGSTARWSSTMPAAAMSAAYANGGAGRLRYQSTMSAAPGHPGRTSP